MDFGPAMKAAQDFASAAEAIQQKQASPGGDVESLNRALLAAEHDLPCPRGFQDGPWYRHSIYAPGEFTGYAAVVILG